MTVKRIGFVGVHSAGKDTLSIHACEYFKLRKRSMYYISEFAEQALMQGMQLNTMHGQLWLVGEQIAQESRVMQWAKREFIICNRTIIDACAYGRYFFDVKSSTLEDICLPYLKTYPYDLIIFLRPLPELEDDGFRMNDRKQQLEIDNIFKNTLDYFKRNSHIDYVEINDASKPERIKTLETILDLYVERWQVGV